ncbi:MAG: Thiol:disulfide interchange protein DsbD [Pseudomonadales bacterium]|nr:Thiol:disulfide interchange protein DsbD [Pseudomonadales bacterium]
MRSLWWLVLVLFPCALFADDEFLDPDLAFRVTARAVDAGTIEVRFDVAEGYYLYREKFRFAVEAVDVTLGEPRLPAGTSKTDEYFGTQEVYFDHVVARLPVQRVAGPETPVTVSVVLQGCAEAGFCYPPQLRALAVTLPAGGTGTSTPPDESGRIASSLANAGLFGNLLFFFVAGLGLSLTPCVFPMIPILSGIIVGQRGQVSRGRGLGLSAAYVLGMALTYSLAGMAAGLTGTLISASLQNPWILGSFALVFVVLSLSMFGFYELQLPASVQSRLNDGAGRLKGGQGVGVFLMGAVSALIVGPCVAAPLAGALLYIGQSGNAVLGGLALFTMAIGMGVPLLAVGLSAGALLPKAGAWMEGVKKVFGVVMLGTAVQLVSPVVPPVAGMLAWAVLLIVPAVYLHALDPLPAGAGGLTRLWKGCGIVMLITGSALLVGVLAGNRDPLQPLLDVNVAQRAGAAGPEQKLPFERIGSVQELQARIDASARPVMLEIYAEWCAACKEMEHLTLGNPQVRARLAEFTLLKSDVTANDSEDKALLRHFGLFGPPGFVFFAPGGREMADKRVVGFQPPERFLSSLVGAD